MMTNNDLRLNRMPRPRRRRAPLIMLAGLALAAAGCDMWLREGGFQWETDHDIARTIQADSQKPLLIYYLAGKREQNAVTSAALEDPAVQPMLDGYVRCRLFHEYEPDRRFVAQYGVERAPALVLIQPDGRYHAHVGPIRAAEAAEWLAAAAAPGDVPAHNPLVPRRIAYHWQSDLDEALARGREAGRPVLVVVYDVVSQHVLRFEELLSREIVHRRFADFEHCRIRAVLGVGAGPAARFNLTQLPAVVIVRPDGSFDALEAPSSPEEVVLFAARHAATTAALASQPGATEAEAGAGGP